MIKEMTVDDCKLLPADCNGGGNSPYC